MVRRRKDHGGLFGCVHLFILPHTLIGIFLFLFPIHSLLVVLFGITVPGHITGKRIGHSSKTNKPYYHANYEYKVGGESYSGSMDPSQSEYASLEIESPVNVRVLPLTPGINSRIVTAAGIKASDIPGVFLMMLFWNGILSIFWWGLLIKPLRDRKLVIEGTACLGVILDKKMTGGKTTTYSIAYRFEPGAGSMIRTETITGKMAIRSKDWDAVRQGDPVTVLYDPTKPKRNIAYDFADYKAI